MPPRKKAAKRAKKKDEPEVSETVLTASTIAAVALPLLGGVALGAALKEHRRRRTNTERFKFVQKMSGVGILQQPLPPVPGLIEPDDVVFDPQSGPFQADRRVGLFCAQPLEQPQESAVAVLEDPANTEFN